MPFGRCSYKNNLLTKYKEYIIENNLLSITIT